MTLRPVRIPTADLPGPRAVPLLGAMGSLMRFFADPVRHLLALSSGYGDVVPLARNDAAIVCAFGAEHNRTVLSDPTRFHNVAEAPMPLPPTSAAARFNGNLTNMNGDVHKTRRRTVMPLFERATVARYRDAMAAEIEQRLARFAPGSTCDVLDEMTELALAISVRCLFGLDGFDARELGALGVDYLRGLIHPLAMMLPMDIPGTPFRRLLRVAERFEHRILALIDERRGAGGDDVLSLLIATGALDDTELAAQAGVFFVAGYETTACTLAWTLFLLAQHPDAYDAVHAEATRVLGGRSPEVSELAQLTELDRVVHESMRLLPAAPLFFLRRATESFALGGRELPAGAIVITSALVTHRDPDLFPDPTQFRPERWASVSPGPYAYLPFGAGPRRCIGASFSAQAIRIVLATLLQRARPVLSPGATVSRIVRGIVLAPKRGLPMRFVAPEERAVPARVRGDIHELITLPA